MIVYLLCILLSTLFAYLFMILKRISRKDFLGSILKRISMIFYIISFVIIFVLSGFRKNVGIDYSSYSTWFNNIYIGEHSYKDRSKL